MKNVQLEFLQQGKLCQIYTTVRKNWKKVSAEQNKQVTNKQTTV